MGLESYFLAKQEPHKEQLKGFVPAWRSMCRLRCSRLENVVLQIVQFMSRTKDATAGQDSVLRHERTRACARARADAMGHLDISSSTDDGCGLAAVRGTAISTLQCGGVGNSR